MRLRALADIADAHADAQRLADFRHVDHLILLVEKLACDLQPACFRLCCVRALEACLDRLIPRAERGCGVLACDEEFHAARSRRDFHREHPGARRGDLLRLAVDEFRDARLHAAGLCEGGVGLERHHRPRGGERVEVAALDGFGDGAQFIVAERAGDFREVAAQHGERHRLTRERRFLEICGPR